MSNCSCFENIYEKYSKNIYVYCYKMTARIHTAQELMQDTFVRFIERCGSMDLRDNELLAYLYKIAHNLCVDFIRKECRFSSIKALLYYSVNSIGIEEQVISDSYSEVMERCLNALTPAQKSIVILHIVERLSHSQIASILDKSEEAVRKQYQRAKEKIRKMLAKEGVVNGETTRLV